MKRISTLFCLIVLLLATATSWGRERRAFYEGVRGRAMGGAQIAVVNDETALLVNPAGLGKLRDFYGTYFDPEVEVSNNLNSMYKDSVFTQPFSIGGVRDTMNASREKHYHAKTQVFPSVVAKNFGLGIYANYLLGGEINAAGDNMDVYYRSDMALALGYNFRFFDGRIKLGFNVKLLNRVELDSPTTDPNGSLDLQSLGVTEGTGLSTDVGLIMTAPWIWLPTLSAVVHDVGNTSFDKANGVRMSTTNRPNMVKQDVDVAVALFPIHTNRVRSSWTIEYRGLLTSSEETDKAKLLHAGMEFNFGDVFFVRGGYNQRYFTGGFELSSENMQVQLASYGEEVGTNTAPKEDRRTVVKLAFRF